MMAYAWGPIPVEQAKTRLEDLMRGFEQGGTLEASSLTFLAELEGMAGNVERARALYHEGIERIATLVTSTRGARCWEAGTPVIPAGCTTL